MSAAIISQLPVKGIRWTLNLALSAFLTWTTLNYFIQPAALAGLLRRFGAAFITALKRLSQRLSPANISNPIA